MSKLREKSEFNIDAAQLLIDNYLYAPSVHCSYYSCFQLMKFTMNNYFGINYDELRQRISVSTSGGTHSYVTHFFNKEVRSKSGIFDYSDFSRKIKDLKEFRESSDYDDVEITIDKSTKALQYATDIRQHIQRNFKK
ncbi:MAG TPA: hypothetical protein VJ954_02960 [Ignavibacteriaceae bacterium]|nr:hypothetical protein [Ignavibacteriaceae bacterium]